MPCSSRTLRANQLASALNPRRNDMWQLRLSKLLIGSLNQCLRAEAVGVLQCGAERGQERHAPIILLPSLRSTQSAFRWCAVGSIVGRPQRRGTLG